MTEAVSPAELGALLQDMCIQNSREVDDPCPGIVVPRDQQREFAFDDPGSRVMADAATIERIDFTPLIADGVLAVTLRLSKNGRPYYSSDDISPDYDGFPDPYGTHEVVWANGIPTVIANQSRALFYRPDYSRRVAPALEHGFADVLSARRAEQIAGELSHLILNSEPTR